jgi:4-amino-4-deoxy-L-arabinose transferase-like glycosyltransferase
MTVGLKKNRVGFIRLSRTTGATYALLALIVLTSVIIKAQYFIGFGLGDDPIYFSLSNNILHGHWPVYSYLNQYAYRPLLLLASAASLWLFGVNDFSFVLPILAASLLSIVVIFSLGATLFNRQTGLLAALLLCVMPASVYNSVTFDNDVIISCTMGVVMLWYMKARQAEGRTKALLYAGAGFMLVISYLFKMTALFLLGTTAAISVADFFLHKERFSSIWFYGSFAFFFGLVLCFYKIMTGEFLYHFHAEKVYYDTYVPSFYMSGAYSVAGILKQYPDHLFSIRYFDGVTFREFGLYAYFFIAAMALMLWKAKRRYFALILLWWVVVLFTILEFLPSNTKPWYLPIPRQERYLEILTMPMVLVIAWAIHWLAKRCRLLAALLFAVLVVNAFINIHARCSLVQDSIADLKKVSQLLCQYKAAEVYADDAAIPQVVFTTSACGTRVLRFDELKKGLPQKGAYIISGGSRIYLWDPALIMRVQDQIPKLSLTPVMSFTPPASQHSKGPMVLYRYDGK